MRGPTIHLSLPLFVAVAIHCTSAMGYGPSRAETRRLKKESNLYKTFPFQSKVRALRPWLRENGLENMLDISTPRFRSWLSAHELNWKGTTVPAVVHLHQDLSDGDVLRILVETQVQPSSVESRQLEPMVFELPHENSKILQSGGFVHSKGSVTPLGKAELEQIAPLGNAALAKHQLKLRYPRPVFDGREKGRSTIRRSCWR